MNSLPAGTVSFLFTDIEGSAKLAQEFPQALPDLLKSHNAILRESIEQNDGHVFQIVGDAFCAAFDSAMNALKASVAAQKRLDEHPWGLRKPSAAGSSTANHLAVGLVRSCCHGPRPRATEQHLHACT